MSESWWHDFFDETYADLFLTRKDLKKLDMETQFITSELGLKSGNLVFDQCCGQGDLSFSLAKKGLITLGIDQSHEYIEKANNQQNLNCQFYTDDAAKFIAPELCDGAFNWHTSFGYSEDDEFNLQIVKRAYDSLNPGGKFILDHNNAAYIFSSLKSGRTFKRGLISGKVQYEVDLLRGMFVSTWSYILSDKSKKVKRGESRIYFPWDLKRIFETAGFCEIKFKGSIDGSELSNASKRCIIIGTKLK